MSIDLTVILKKKTTFNSNHVIPSDFKINTIDKHRLEKTSTNKRRITFSKINTMFSSEIENDSLPNLSEKITKSSILKKSNTKKYNGLTKKP